MHSHPGSYRVNSTFSSCCWVCIPCLRDSITSTTNQYKCHQCPSNQISNMGNTHCLALTDIRMNILEVRSLIHLGLAVFGILSTFLVVCVFFKFWDTPVVKSASREMSCVQVSKGRDSPYFSVDS